MPVIHVRGLPQKTPVRIQQALRRVTAAVAEACGCKPEQVWATWEDIKPGFYFEGQNAASLQPANTHPLLAEILCFEGLASDIVEKTVAAAAKALGEGLGIGMNVFVSYRELKSGEVAAGDGVIRKKAP